MARRSVVSINTCDAFRLQSTLYEPYRRGQSPAVAVINSGAGIPSIYYEAYASWLADNGLAVLTYDYRGIGASRSRSIRGLMASIYDWGSKDCAAALGWANKRYPGANLYVIAHSIGAVVTGFVKKPPEIAKMLFISPHTGHWREYAPAARRAMFIKWHVVLPIVTATARYFPGRLLGYPEDLPFAVAMEWGLRRGNTNPVWRAEGGPAERNEQDSFPHFRLPVLTIRPSDDPFATDTGMQHVARLYFNCAFFDLPIDAKTFGAKLGHLGFFMKQSSGSLWKPTLDWLQTGAF